MTTTLDQFVHRIRRIALIACIVAWAGAITATHLPPRDLPSMEVSDKLLHTVGFGGLAGIFGLTLAAYGKGRRRRLILMLAIMPLYGALDELTQPIFGRDCDVMDWVFDVIGTASAFVLVELALAGLGYVWRANSRQASP